MWMTHQNPGIAPKRLGIVNIEALQSSCFDLLTSLIALHQVFHELSIIRHLH